jgi:hypothetical protein
MSVPRSEIRKWMEGRVFCCDCRRHTRYGECLEREKNDDFYTSMVGYKSRPRKRPNVIVREAKVKNENNDCQDFRWKLTSFIWRVILRRWYD